MHLLECDIVEAFDNAWAVLKMPLRGTNADYFDQSMQQGIFEPRQGQGAYTDTQGVWASSDDGQEGQETAFDYAMKIGEQGMSNRVPLIHHIPDTVEGIQQGGNFVGDYSYAIRYPEGVKAEDTQEIWRGQSFNDWKNNRNMLQRLFGLNDLNSYYHNQRKDFERALKEFKQRQGQI